MSPDDDSSSLTPWERIFQTFRGGSGGYSPSQVARMNDAEKRSYISALDPTERILGLVGAALAVVVSLVLIVPYMVSKKYAVTNSIKLTKHTKCPVTVAVKLKVVTQGGKKACEGIFPPSHFLLNLVIPLAFAVLVLVAVLFLRRRTWVAMGLVILGLSMSTLGLLVTLPFLVGGGWIMLRAYRTQKYGVPNKKIIVEGWVPPPPKTAARRPGTGTGPPSRSGSSRPGKASSTSTSAKKAPSANKRYTPRTPPKPVKKGASS